ncbi:hypothetical protein [Adhaeretor mobilis]|uniref:Uncharacterized protein n=1 Tax=Adhaeretor mobilis TaxID=1930276 RepID=A0A517MTI4_9BACT|nr:hypothetical protein [Adhaeretor mobilis]QDS98198.1 hypothetical protein HG15A2_14710 [Adhaeretor mobilis]
MASAEELANVLRAVVFVETHVRMPISGRLRTVNGNATEGRFQQSDIIRVLPLTAPQGHATAIGFGRW